MKHLITLCLLMVATYTISAQTLPETMTYFNANTLNYAFPDKEFAAQCTENYFQFPKSIDTDSREVLNIDRISLKDIKSISYSAKDLYYRVIVIGSGFHYKVHNGELANDNKKIEQTSMNLDIKTPEENVKRIIKAMKHAAELGGAKLIKDDLFKD